MVSGKTVEDSVLRACVVLSSVVRGRLVVNTLGVGGRVAAELFGIVLRGTASPSTCVAHPADNRATPATAATRIRLITRRV